MATAGDVSTVTNMSLRTQVPQEMVNIWIDLRRSAQGALDDIARGRDIAELAEQLNGEAGDGEAAQLYDRAKALSDFRAANTTAVNDLMQTLGVNAPATQSLVTLLLTTATGYRDAAKTTAPQITTACNAVIAALPAIPRLF